MIFVFTKVLPTETYAGKIFAKASSLRKHADAIYRDFFKL